MTSRKHILASLAHHLDRDSTRADRGHAAEERLSALAANLVPERGQKTPAARRDLFIKYAKAADATVARVRKPSDVPAAVAEFLAGNNLSSSAVRAPDGALDDIPWDSEKLLELRTGKAEPGDETSITGAFAGIAETGTLMLLSGKGSPTTLNFLPENHIVILFADQLAASYEEAWTRLRGAGSGKGKRKRKKGTFEMPRTVNFITGPSRSADIEQTLQLGAHGPRRLHIILVDGRKEGKR